MNESQSQPRPQELEMIEVPSDIQEAAEASRAERQEAFEADVAQAALIAAQRAAEINATRPEGVPSTLPLEGVTTSDRELTPATVRSPRV